MSLGAPCAPPSCECSPAVGFRWAALQPTRHRSRTGETGAPQSHGPAAKQLARVSKPATAGACHVIATCISRAHCKDKHDSEGGLAALSRRSCRRFVPPSHCPLSPHLELELVLAVLAPKQAALQQGRQLWQQRLDGHAHRAHLQSERAVAHTLVCAAGDVFERQQSVQTCIVASYTHAVAEGRLYGIVTAYIHTISRRPY